MRRLIFLLLAVGVFALPVMADTVTLTLIPANGLITGYPGETIGWGFTITNTTNYIVVTSASFVAGGPSIGVFTDFISAYNFIVVGPSPESNTVSQAFDPILHTGIGSFTINPGVGPNVFVHGNIVLTYDLFSVSPNDPLWDPDVDTLATDHWISAPATAGTVPEPASLLLLGSGLALLGGVYLRRRRA